MLCFSVSEQRVFGGNSDGLQIVWDRAFPVFSCLTGCAATLTPEVRLRYRIQPILAVQGLAQSGAASRVRYRRLTSNFVKVARNFIRFSA